MFKTYFLAIVCLLIAAECMRRARRKPEQTTQHIPCHDLTGQRVTAKEVQDVKDARAAAKADRRRLHTQRVLAERSEQTRLATFAQSRAARS